MLRRTAARAFGAGTASSDVPPARHETHRGAAVERLFGGLHDRLAESVERRQAELEAADPDALQDLEAMDASSLSADEAGKSVQITRPRALPEGVEFTLIGPSYLCRFVNTMTGFIRVNTHRVEDREAATESVRAEVLSVHPYWGTFRPFLKPLRFRAHGACPARTAFCYTSAEELSAHYLDVVCGK